jgi:hypothetical protein
MFNLEQAIADWRQQMLAAGFQTPAPLEELEAHLREEIERQTKMGLNPQDAFSSAVQELGPAHTVQNEFMKVDTIQVARQWKLTEIFLMLVTILLPLFVGGIVLKRGSFANMTAAEQLSCLVALVAFSLLAWSGRLGHRLLPVIRTRRIRDGILCVCFGSLMLWWIVFFNFIVPHHDFTMGEFLVTFMWAFFTPAGACLGLHWGIETAARKEVVRAGS